MDEYKFIDGISGRLLSPETRRYFAIEKLDLTVALHKEQAAKNRKIAEREVRVQKLIEEWGFDPLYLEFLDDESIKSILYGAEILYEQMTK